MIQGESHALLVKVAIVSKYDNCMSSEGKYLVDFTPSPRPSLVSGSRWSGIVHTTLTKVPFTFKALGWTQMTESHIFRGIIEIKTLTSWMRADFELRAGHLRD